MRDEPRCRGFNFPPIHADISCSLTIQLLLWSLFNLHLHAEIQAPSHILASSEQLPAVVPHYCQPPGAGAFSRDLTLRCICICLCLTTNLTPQCRAFSGALKNEKLKAPLFSGPRGAGDTDYWCIT